MLVVGARPPGPLPVGPSCPSSYRLIYDARAFRMKTSEGSRSCFGGRRSRVRLNATANPTAGGEGTSGVTARKVRIPLCSNESKAVSRCLQTLPPPEDKSGTGYGAMRADLFFGFRRRYSAAECGRKRSGEDSAAVSFIFGRERQLSQNSVQARTIAKPICWTQKPRRLYSPKVMGEELRSGSGCRSLVE